jgi:amino acid transporter
VFHEFVQPLVGFFTCLVTAAFTFGGIETVAVAAGETENPRSAISLYSLQWHVLTKVRKKIPKVVHRVFWRILIFYIFGTLAIGVMVPYTDANLLGAQKTGALGAARSPWVISISEAGIPILPSILNAVILTSATSSGNAFLYNGSRYLYALAQNRQAPIFLLKCTKSGTPIYRVCITGAMSLITYMAVSAGGANVFAWVRPL